MVSSDSMLDEKVKKRTFDQFFLNSFLTLLTEVRFSVCTEEYFIFQNWLIYITFTPMQGDDLGGSILFQIWHLPKKKDNLT
jgi:hypothetical protein